MSPRRWIAWTLYAVTAAISAVLGAIYLFRGSFMPYRAAALDTRWAEVEPALQVLLVALMRVAGGGWLALALIVAVLLARPFREGWWWARLGIPAALLVFYVPSLIATLEVLYATPAAPPWWGNGMAITATLLAAGLDLSSAGPRGSSAGIAR